MADEGKKSKRRSRKEKPVADAPAEGEQRAESPRAAEAPAESPRAASSSPPEASHAASSSPAASSSSSSSSDPVPEFRRGKIYVNVPQGKDLPGGTKINPYWKAIVYPPREKLHRSEPLQKTDNPEWGNKGYLLILEEKHSTLEELRIEVWSQGSLSFRKKLGLVHFPLRVLLDGIPRAGWFECQPIPDEKKSGGGQITLQILYLPNDLDLTAQKYEFSETLHCLMRKNQRDCVQTLLRSHKEQVDMAQLDHSGRTPLQVAVELQDVEFIRLLVDNGAAVDGKNATGATALHHAVGLASEEVITTLLGLGATIDIQDKDGNTPLHFASGENHTAGLRVLLRNRANLNVQNAAGDLPVMLAIRKEHLEVVFELASRDPALGPRTDIYLKNAAGESVADMLSNDKIPFPSITNFMRGAGIIDHREVTLLNKYPHRYHISGSGENILRSNWKLSPQFSLRLAGAAASSSGAASSSSSSSSSGPKVAILVHHTHNHFVDNQMQNIGLIAVDSIQGEHFEPSFQQNFGGRATSEPLELKFKPDLPFICLIPFARNEPAEGMFNILVFSEAPLEHAQLRPWKHIKSVQSKWEGESAGGPRGKPNFSKNPRVTLSLPSGHQSLAVNILIEQPRNVIDLDPYTVRPYALSIGYYIFDSNCTELIGQVPGFRNAQESFHVFNFDTTKHKKFTIIPATHEEGRESAFGITVFCDESFRLKVSK